MSFDPIHIFIIVAGALGFYAFQVKGRRKMLSCKCGADSIYALYLFGLGGTTGAMGACIAAFGGAIQVVTPPHMMKKTLPYRFVIACALSVAGAYFLSRNMTDVYPFIGVIISRFVELFHSTLILRLGFFCASVPWLVYNYSNGFYLAMVAGLLMMAGMLLGMFKNERRLPKDPVP